MNLNGPTTQIKRVTLIEGPQQLMRPVYEALKEEGYPTRLFRDMTKALTYLAQTDVLLIDASMAKQPQSGQFIKAPIILVFTQNGEDKLPAWLEAGHVHLLSYPRDTQELVHYMEECIATLASPPEIDLTNTEHLALLFRITQSLSGHLDIQELFERILAQAPALGGSYASLLIQEGDETIYYRSTLPGCEELTGPAGRRFAQRLIEEGLEGWVLQHYQTVILTDTRQDQRWFRASYLPDETHSAVAIPITLDRIEARGVYLIGHEQIGQFTKSDIPLLQAATIQFGLAIENAILLKNQSERSVQLSLINVVSQAATSILNLDVMLRTVVEAIRRSFAFYNVSIHLYDPSSQQVELRARVASDQQGPVSKAERVIYKVREGLIGWAAATSKTILANDVTQEPRYIPDHGGKEIRSELCVPITLGVKTIGVLDLKSTQLEAFDKHHVSALETLADQLAVAIENARLYDEINQRVNELKTLNEIGLAITSTLDLQKTLTLITDLTTRLMNVAAASVALRYDEINEIKFAAAFGEGSEAVIGLRLPRGEGIAGWVAETGEPVMVPDVANDPRFCANVDQSSGFTTKSILCVPLQTKGQIIGAIEVMNKRNGTFNQEDISLLQSLAVSAATAIENAQLYEEKIKTIQRLAEAQNQNEQLFRQTEALRAFNEDIIQNMTNGLIAVDKDKRITAFNPAAASMLGCQKDEVLNQPIQEAIGGAEELIAVLSKTLTTSQPCPHREISIRHWDGTKLPISVSTAPLTIGEAGHKWPGVVGVLEDLSEIKALEAERRQLDRLAALGEMSAVVAHEIRNPIAGIGAGIEYLTRNTPSDSPDYEGVKMIQGEIERVNHILEDILFVARPLQLSLSSEDLAEIIDSVIQRCQPNLKESRVTVSCNYDATCPPLKIDRQRLEQVFTNLFINATQAMGHGGQLTLQTQSRPRAGEVIVTIADTGPGIPAETQRRIFEPFFTTKAKGTGLGLSVARRIIEEHGGSIQVESEEKKGTRFIIKLPMERKVTR